ncbi:DUF488 family protein [Thioflexithrix psekupsensis]|uniref:DUF488 domain-containing protein n=1 Tax=Thioflexithrix psekupsensis TaxID=1570016 RepID=A0A251X8M4_9GAMM|nr:DUF488 domain-containing protein [Thioflexithrix psekupsensis]OUD13882.1 hypothetical protein TPSD3_05925 [Thioflexithrix psekupsensis]
MNNILYSIGHSNHDITAFIDLLKINAITAIADVRSQPYSRYASQYNMESLKTFLLQADISYVFLGKELGARSSDISCYQHGKLQFSKLAQQSQFIQGLERLKKGMKSYSIALLCAEKDPIECHRAILVARQLHNENILVKHIHADGSTETQNNMEDRLLHLCKLPESDMFNTREQLLNKAYEIQAERIAYADNTMKEVAA